MTNWEYLEYFLNVIYMTNISYMIIVIKMEVETITKDQSPEMCKNTLIVLDTHYKNFILDYFYSFIFLLGHFSPKS